MRAFRRGWFVPAFLLLIAAPALFQLVLPDAQREERRTLASRPAWPATLAEARHLPQAVDRWLDDRFGLRQPLVRVNNWLRWHLFGEIATNRIIIGRHGRLFLAGHDSGEATLITDLCGVGIGDATIARGADLITQGLERVRAAGFDAALLLVPTAPRLYPEDIPAPLDRACAGRVPPVDRLAAEVAASDVGADLIYPVDQMLAMKTSLEPIPRHHFHWAGEAPVRVAEAVAEGHWQLPRTLELPLRPVGRASDLNNLNPGMGASDPIREPDVRAVGITTCVAAACGSIDGLAPGAAAAVTRYRRPAPGPQLLVVADSFGDEIARNFLEQFGTVWHLQTNDLAAMAPADRQALAAWLAGRFKGERVLYVYHDAAALDGLGVITELFWPPPP